MFDTLLNNADLVGVVTGLLVAGLTTLFIWVRKLVATSKTNLDDKIVVAVEKALEDSKKKK